jgi:hypothetical protein
MITNWISIAVSMTTDWSTYQLLMYDLRWARRRNLRIYWKPLSNRSLNLISSPHPKSQNTKSSD